MTGAWDRVLLYMACAAAFAVILGFPLLALAPLGLVGAIAAVGTWRDSPTGEPVRYAAPAVPFVNSNEYLVFDSIAPEAPFIWRKDAIGEHARWYLWDIRAKYEWKGYPTWRQLLTGTWQKWHPTNLTIVRVTWWQQALAWLFTIYVLASILTRARKD